MSDLHFILRYGLTGVALIVFFAAGLAMRGLGPAESMAMVYPAGLANVVALGVLPTFGIAVQGFYVIVVALCGRFFTDEARRMVRERVLEALAAERPTLEAKRYAALSRALADSSFVWLYYMDAPAHLIDWARRRRSYHYLGVDFALAALAGVLAGAFDPWYAPAHGAWANGFEVAVIAAATLLWIVAAVYLAVLMKRNVDDMELVWAHARLTPEFRASMGFQQADNA